jgi:hypothetical protein
MPGRTASNRSLGKGKTVPDSWDVQAILQAIYDDFGASAEMHIFQTLTGDMLVECTCSAMGADGHLKYFGCHRVFHTVSAPIVVLMMQCGHRVWHDLDRCGTLLDKEGPRV